MFAGSIGSGTVLGAPDLVVLTLTEFAEQIRRIARGSDLPLMVDADHHLHLVPLCLLGQHVALLSGGEAELGRGVPSRGSPARREKEICCL